MKRSEKLTKMDEADLERALDRLLREKESELSECFRAELSELLAWPRSLIPHQMKKWSWKKRWGLLESELSLTGC